MFSMFTLLFAMIFLFTLIIVPVIVYVCTAGVVQLPQLWYSCLIGPACLYAFFQIAGFGCFHWIFLGLLQSLLWCVTISLYHVMSQCSMHMFSQYEGFCKQLNEDLKEVI